MQTVEEVYKNSVQPLSESDQRKLASMILKKVGENGSRKIVGRWNGKEITEEEYRQLDHNERIDFDLSNAYADNHGVER